MLYKGSTDIYKEVAKRLGVSFDLVESIGIFSWKEANEIVSTYKHRELYMYGFGTWRFRKRKADRYVDKELKIKENMIRLHTDESSKNKALESVEYKLEIFKKFISDWNKVIEEKEAKKIVRYEYEAAKRSIQEQREDLEGVEEQCIQE